VHKDRRTTAETVQKTINPSKAIQRLACSHFCPPYPQPDPQSLGATQIVQTHAIRGLWATHPVFLLDLLKRICHENATWPSSAEPIARSSPEIALPAEVFPTVAHRLIHRPNDHENCIKNQPFER
jgi:hypothetical protein